MLDVRRTFVIGLGFALGLAVDFYPTLFAGLPSSVRPFVSSSLGLGTVAALTLNALFRLGVRLTQTLLDPARLDTREIADFMERRVRSGGRRATSSTALPLSSRAVHRGGAVGTARATRP
jgi:NCS2 family nucleobase:cation symporter-2